MPPSFERRELLMRAAAWRDIAALRARQDERKPFG